MKSSDCTQTEGVFDVKMKPQHPLNLTSELLMYILEKKYFSFFFSMGTFLLQLKEIFIHIVYSDHSFHLPQ